MPREPTLAEVIRDGIDGRLADVHTCTVGRVVSYDSLKQVANVQPVIRRPFNIGGGEVDHEQLPILPNVPVLWPRAGGFFIHLPLAAGDHVLLVFSQDDLSTWREAGSIVEPDDLRRHSLANAVAIPGIGPEGAPLSPSPLSVAARAGGMVLGDGGAAEVHISSSEIKLGQAAVMPVALAPPTDANFAALFAGLSALATTVANLVSMVGTHTHAVATTGTAAAQAGTAAAVATPPTAPGAAPTAGPTTAALLVKAT